MISNFFVLSPRGDTIIFKQYRSSTLSSSSDTPTTTTMAHERSHTEAFFRKIKFWDDTSMMTSTNTLDSFMTQQLLSNQNQNYNTLSDPNSNDMTSSNNNNNNNNEPATSSSSGTNNNSNSSNTTLRTGDAPPVFPMPDGHTYIHIKRNGLVFAASTIRNISPNTVLEVRVHFTHSTIMGYVVSCYSFFFFSPSP
jgi:hypothetical protein